jgi:hypothetical protein
MSAANVASLVFFIFSLIAAAAVEFLMKAFAEEAGASRWFFVVAPAWFAALYSQILYWNADRKVRHLSQSVSRAVVVMLLTWVSVAALTTWTWCQPRQFASCLAPTLMVSGVVGALPMLIGALSAGALIAALIIPRPRL